MLALGTIPFLDVQRLDILDCALIGLPPILELGFTDDPEGECLYLEGWKELWAAGDGSNKAMVDAIVWEDGQLPEQAASPLHPVNRL